MLENIICYVYQFAYVLALSLQLSAGILLIGNTNVSRKGIIREYCARHTAIAFEQNGKLANSSSLREVVKSSWLNHSAFVYLCAGYVVSVFGEALPNKLFAFGAIVVLTAIISLVTIFIAKNKSKKFEPISKDDLDLNGGVSFCILE